MSPDAKRKYDPDPNLGKDCPICEQEFHGTCPLRSSDCPFAYEDDDDDNVDALDLDDEEEESSLLPDFGLDDDFDEEEDEEPDFLAPIDDD